MRRLSLSGLGLIAIFALAACSGASSGGSSSPAAASASAVPASPPAASAPASATGACAETTDAATVEVKMSGRSFSPKTVQAKVGDVVGWTNSDSVPHNAIFDGCRTPTLDQNSSASLVFSAPGTYAYACGIHPTMTATIEVTE